ncbi:MAG: hypothetical protein ACU83O_15105 [Gammaproteobacteria bacterium]
MSDKADGVVQTIGFFKLRSRNAADMEEGIVKIAEDCNPLAYINRFRKVFAVPTAPLSGQLNPFAKEKRGCSSPTSGRL